MNDITKKLLSMISDISGEIKGAFNIREDGGCAGRQSTENVDIIPKVGQPGIDIIIKPGTHETVYIPACVTKSNVDDLVYNDFYVAPASALSTRRPTSRWRRTATWRWTPSRSRA